MMRHCAIALAAALALGLAGCDRGATENANAPGSPGTGNAREVASPHAPDSSNASGPSGVKGSAPHPGSSGADAVAGTTGGGTEGASVPGTGLNGGLRGNTDMAVSGSAPNANTPTQAMGAAGDGTTNRTP